MIALATDLQEVLTGMGYNIHEHVFCDKDVERLIAEVEFARVIDQAGTDVIAFADMAHSLFETGGEVRFAELLDLLHSMRGSNPAQVKDVKSTLKAVKAAVKESEHAICVALIEEINELRVELHDLKKMSLDLKEMQQAAEEDDAVQSDLDEEQSG